MSSAAPTSTSSAAPVSFFVELENAAAALRLYGEEHPVLLRSAQQAAASVKSPLRASIGPRGFLIENEAEGQAPDLARRLRSLSVAGIEVRPGLTGGQVVELVRVLRECEREHCGIAALVKRIGSSTGELVTAVPLRLGNLNLVAGTSSAEASNKDAGALCRELFRRAQGGSGGTVDIAQLATAFESAAQSAQSAGEWDEVVDEWTRELGDLQVPAGEGGGLPRERVKALGTFLRRLNPGLCRRLMTETVSRNAASDSVVTALAEHLPVGVVIDALAGVDRNNAQPSSAALALLRKVSGEASRQDSQFAARLAVPMSNAELAEVSSALHRMLESKNEGAFVPAEYLQRRQELSAGTVAGHCESEGFSCPTEQQTTRHAAELVLQMLSTDAEAAHITAALEYLKQRMASWIRTGQFDLAGEGVAASRRLLLHSDDEIGDLALAVAGGPIAAEDLLEGAERHSNATEPVSRLLMHCDGVAVASLLRSEKLKQSNSPAAPMVLEAVRRVLSDASGDRLRSMVEAMEAHPRQSAASLLAPMPEGQAMKTLEAMLPLASAALRKELLGVIFKKNLRWELPLAQTLLKDASAAIRRLAVMRLMRDHDLGTAAAILKAAAQGTEYQVDVAQGLAELLHPYRLHPDVRSAYRSWRWSGRRWLGFISFTLGEKRDAA